MYRKPKFLELLHHIRQEMARECDYDMDRLIQSLQNDTSTLKSALEGVPVGPEARRRSRNSRRKKR